MRLLVGCKKIREIPSNLFKYNTEVEKFLGTFYSCEELKNIPRNLINNSSKIKDTREMFAECKNLETIPIEIINKVMSGSIDYEGMFYGCTKADNYNNIPDRFKK